MSNGVVELDPASGKVSEVIDTAEIGTARRLTIAAIGAWVAAAAIAGGLGVVNEPGRPPLALASFFVIPIGGFVGAYLTSASFRAFTRTIPLWVLVGSHVWRFVGLGFVIGWLTGALPAGFGIPAGFGDIIAAAGALILLPRVRDGRASRKWLLAWNILGILDLAAAITLGVLYSESTAGVLHTATASTKPLVTFPVSLIPTFFVPLFLLAHALTFRRIARLGGTPNAVPR